MSPSPPTIDLRPDHWEIVREILQRQLPDRHVFAFGSRATWTAKDYSDLDLAIMGEQPLPVSVLSALSEDFIDSDLPFRVDVVDFASVEDSFRDIIQQHGVPVQSPLDVTNSTIHVSEKVLKTIQQLVTKHLPNTDAWVYRDRLKEESSQKSDLNIVVFSSPEQQQKVIDLRRAFDGSDLPFCIDLLVWNDLPDEPKEQIEAEHVKIQSRAVFDDHYTKEENLTRHGWTTFGECAVLIRDTVVPSDIGADVPYVGLEHIGEGTLSMLSHGRAEDVVSAKFQFQQGDILFGKLRPYFRKVVRAPFDGICSTDIWVVRSSGKADTGFLYYLMASQQFVNAATQGSEGTRMPRAKWDDVSRYRVLLPSFPEQHAIARILGTLDDKIKLNRRMNETLENMARALFKSWFVDFDPVRAKTEGQDTGLPKHIADLLPGRLMDSEIGMIPEGWEVKPLDAIAHFQNGLALQKHRPTKGQARLPVVKIAQLRTGRANSKEWARADIKPECILNNGDVVFSWSGSLLVHIWCGGTAALNQHLFKVTSNKFPKWFYLHCVLAHLSNFQQIAQDKATTMGHIKRKHLNDALCAVAPDSVMFLMSHIFNMLLRRQIMSELESRTLTTLRDTLLPKLILGRIRLPKAETGMEAQT